MPYTHFCGTVLYVPAVPLLPAPGHCRTAPPAALLPDLGLVERAVQLNSCCTIPGNGTKFHLAPEPEPDNLQELKRLANLGDIGIINCPSLLTRDAPAGR